MRSRFFGYFLCIIPILVSAGEGPRALSLAEAEQIALQANPQRRASLLMKEQAMYQCKDAYSRLLPRFALSGTLQHTEIGGADGYDWVTRSSVGMRQVLWSSEAYHGYKAAKIEECRASDLDLEQANELLYAVRLKYYQTLLEQNRVQAEGENIRLLKESLELEQTRKEIGESTAFAVQQSQVALTTAWSGYYAALRRAKVARNELAVLLGEDPVRPPALAMDQISFDEMDVVQEGLAATESENLALDAIPGFMPEDVIWEWESLAVDRRPDLRRIRTELCAADRQVKRRRGEYYPEVSAFVDYHNNSTGKLTFLSRESYWDAGVRLDWTLFDSFGRENRGRAACANRGQVHYLLEGALRQAKADVRNRFSEMEEALLGYHAAVKSVAFAEESVRLAKQRREVGVMTPLEFRDATYGLTQARQQELQAAFQVVAAYYGLRHVSGADIAWIEGR